MRLIKATIQNYHIKNSKINKKAVYISFLEPVSTRNIAGYQAELKSLLEKKFDLYLIKLTNKSEITAYTIKLLLALYNTQPDNIAIHFSESLEEFLYNTRLGKYFIAEKSAKIIIMKLEGKNKELRSKAPKLLRSGRLPDH